MLSSTDSSNLPPFSVLLPVYEGAEKGRFEAALSSITDQTIPPDEIIVVKDGPLTDELDRVLQQTRDVEGDLIRVVSISRNVGLGRALNIGLEQCSHSIVARMDADDVSKPDRFEQQLHYLVANPQTAVVGGYIGEAETASGSINHVRTVPTDRERLEEMATTRCPLNHPTVMFRKEAIEEVGGYADMRSMQDYELWARMLSEGYVLANIPEILVTTDAGDDVYDRRGGIDYVRAEIALQRRFLEMGHVTPVQAAYNLAMRVPVRFLPHKVRKLLYQTLLRDASPEGEDDGDSPDLSVLYIVSTLERSGPTNQLYNLVSNLDTSICVDILTLSPEPDDTLRPKFNNLDVNFHSLGLSRLKGVFQAPSAIADIADEINPDVVHTQGIRADSIAAHSLSKFPRVTTIRNYPYEDYPAKFNPIQGYMMAFQHLRAYKRIDYPVACSETIAARIAQHDIDAHAIQNGVNADQYAPVDGDRIVELRKQLDLPQDKGVIVSVGSLIDRKDPLTVIEGYANSSIRDKVTLVFLGDGPLRDECEAAAEGLNVRFEGQVDNVNEYLNAADLFASASTSEGLPNSVMEALASGVPVCLSSIGPHQEILQFDENAGILFEPENPEALSDALDSIVTRNGDQISKAARAIVTDHLSAARMAHEYQQLYAEVSR